MDRPFFPVFVLTLPGDESRRAELTEWLRAHRIDYELFHGVDGRGGLDASWEDQIDRPAAAQRLGRPMGDGEFACALSHQEIYRTVLERGIPGAVILEDDARPTEGFARFLAGRHYAAAEMILLDHSNTRATRRAPVEILEGVVAYRVALPPFLTTGYSISARAAEFLRAESLPISFTADWPCDIARIGAVAAMPRLVGHPPTAETSHIDRDRGARQRRSGRLLSRAYWRRWWRKRRAVGLPDA